MDFDLLEYDKNGKPLAIFEYKHFNQRFFDLTKPGLVAIASLASASDIPAFLVCYCLANDEDLPHNQSEAEFLVIGLNTRAKHLLSNEPQHMSEHRFAALHYHVRNENKASLPGLNLSKVKTPELFSSHVIRE